MIQFDKWLKTFVEEKELPMQNWELEDENGNVHHIGLDNVIENLLTETADIKRQVKGQLVKIDVLNGDVMDFFKYLAQWYVNLATVNW